MAVRHVRGAGLCPAAAADLLVIQAHGRTDRAGEPVHAEVVEQPFERHRAERRIGQGAAVVRPFVELLADPRRQASGRVQQSVGQRLRTRRLDRLIAHASGGVPAGSLQIDAVRVGHDRLADLLRRHRHSHHRLVERADVLGVPFGERDADDRTPVASEHEVLLVAQVGDQCVQRVGDDVDVHTGSRGHAREPVPRQRRHDHVKRVRWVGRVGQRFDHVEELDHRPRPAVHQHERAGLRMRRASVDRVHLDTTNAHLERAAHLWPAVATIDERVEVVVGPR